LRKQFLAYPAIHLMVVHGYSRFIAQMENVDGHTLFITEVAAYVFYRERYGRLLQTRISSGDERKCVQDRKRKISSGADV
jgi:hypothetical protein